jgi:hypothetical protein
MSASQAMMDDESNFDWMDGFENQMSFGNSNEHAIEGSSPQQSVALAQVASAR